MKGMQKIKRGSGFRGALNYALEREKGKDAGEIIGGNMSGTDPQTLAREFGAARRLRPDIAKPVWHNSLRLTKGERLTKAQLNAIGDNYMRKMGFSDAHPRVYVLHDDPEGQHIHIIACRVALDGSVYLGQNENLVSTRHIQELEKVHDLVITKGPEYDPTTGKVIMPDKRKLKKVEIEMALKGNEPARQKISRIIDEALDSKSISAIAFIERLEAGGITVLPAMAKSTNKLNGFTFVCDGIPFKGSDIGDKYGLGGLLKRGLTYEQDADGDRVRHYTEAARFSASSLGNTGEPRDKSRDVGASASELVGRDAGAVGGVEDAAKEHGRAELEKLRATLGISGRNKEGSAGNQSINREGGAGITQASGDRVDTHGTGDGGAYGRVIDLAAPQASDRQQNPRKSSGRSDNPVPTGGAALPPDAKVKIESWRTQSAALGAERYRITLKDRVLADGKDHSHNAGKRKDGEIFYSAQEVEDMIPRLRRENARGFDIYVTPIDPHYSFLVVDDLNNGNLQRLQNDGFAPCIIQSSSHDNYQAIIKIEKDFADMNNAIANRLVKQLNTEFGDPKFSGVVHPFRMAGYSNKKPGKNNYFTKVIQAVNIVCEKAQEIFYDLRDSFSKTESSSVINKNLLDANEGAFFEVFKQAEEAAIINGWPIDHSICDYWASQKMLVDGYTTEQTMDALLSESPDVLRRHPDPDDYARRTVTKAFLELEATRRMAERENDQEGHAEPSP